MSTYGKLTKAEGNAKWFLLRTLDEHDRSMDHPWMKMMYSKLFSIEQYASWLAQMHAVFQRLEQHLESKPLKGVHDAALLRTPALESDLQQLLGSDWHEQVNKTVQSSPAAQLYLEHLDEDALDTNLLLAHHFLNYNAVLSCGEHLGRMVSEKLRVPHGASGVQFYCVDCVKEGKGSARVQKYLASLDTLEISSEDRECMLTAMRRIYADMEAMMTDVYNIQPVDGQTYHEAKAASDAEGPQQWCPISGKAGTGCPMAAIMGGGNASADPTAKASSSTSPATSKSFMAGKSLVASVNKDTSSQDSHSNIFCPLHWDDSTMKLVFVVAGAAWLNGILIGWKLHRKLSS